MPQRKRPPGQLQIIKDVDVQYKEGYVLLSPVNEKSNASAVFVYPPTT
jgi:hypothetical protein